MNKCETLETLYDRHVRTVYGIALKYSRSVAEAEKIVCDVFRNLNLEEINSLKNVSICHFLVSKTIKLCRKEKREFKENEVQDDKQSFVNKIMYHQKPLDEICDENKQSRSELFRDVRNEFQSRS
jgi:DNA-directed RNA polymerase specialized sigma24 family protein